MESRCPAWCPNNFYTSCKNKILLLHHYKNCMKLWPHRISFLFYFWTIRSWFMFIVWFLKWKIWCILLYLAHSHKCFNNANGLFLSSQFVANIEEMPNCQQLSEFWSILYLWRQKTTAHTSSASTNSTVLFTLSSGLGGPSKAIKPSAQEQSSKVDTAPTNEAVQTCSTDSKSREKVDEVKKNVKSADVKQVKVYTIQ